MNLARRSLLLPVIIALLGIGLAATPASADPSSVRINEFSSNSPDFVELVNTARSRWT